MASRLLPRPCQLRLTATAASPSFSRSIMTRSERVRAARAAEAARAARKKNNPKPASQSAERPPPAINGAARAAAAAIPQVDTTFPASSRARQPSSQRSSRPAASSKTSKRSSPLAATNPTAAASSQRPARPSPFADPDDPLNLRPHASRIAGGSSGEAPGWEEYTKENPPVMRFYTMKAEDMNDPTKAPTPLTDELIESDTREAKKVWAEIQKLEAEIRDLESGDDPALDSYEMHLRELMQLPPGSEIEIPSLLKFVDKAQNEMLEKADPDAVNKELDALAVVARGGAEDGEELGRKGTEALERLNNFLRHAYLATDPLLRPSIRQELWKAYTRAKLHVPRLLQSIPLPAWDMLFYTQAVKWKSNKLRDKHLKELLADMKTVGLDGPPTPPPAQSLEEYLDDFDPED